MYYITEKTVKGNTAAVRVLGTSEKRDNARKIAAEKDGTVRTQEEFDAMSAKGMVDSRTIPGYVKSVAIIAENTAAKAEKANKPAGRWTSVAEEINKTSKARNTLGKKEKVLKRVQTSEAALKEAVKFIGTLSEKSKVDVVRDLARWVSSTKEKLQRRDAFELLKGHTIADATISTQWQLVRSGKAPAAKA